VSCIRKHAIKGGFFPESKVRYFLDAEARGTREKKAVIQVKMEVE